MKPAGDDCHFVDPLLILYRWFVGIGLTNSWLVCVKDFDRAGDFGQHLGDPRSMDQRRLGLLWWCWRIFRGMVGEWNEETVSLCARSRDYVLGEIV